MENESDNYTVIGSIKVTGVLENDTISESSQTKSSLRTAIILEMVLET